MKSIYLFPMFIIIMALALMTLPLLPTFLVGSQQNMMIMTFLIVIPILIGLTIFITKDKK